MTPALRLLTFEDVVELAENRRSKARADDKVAGWDRLLDVARGLAGSGGGGDDLAVGRTWSLVKIRIQGYQGVSVDVPLEIDLDPTPGVTVLHGINGSGKSSIADAIETALHGAPRKPVSTGGGGSEPLWERQHCGRDADEALVEVTVLAGGERLVLSCRLNPDGQVVERRAQHVVDSSATDVDLTTTTWHSALAGLRPVFGYAAVERQVQLARNLQEFLEPLLALGGCFDAPVCIAAPGCLAQAEPVEHRAGAARAAVVEVDRSGPASTPPNSGHRLALEHRRRPGPLAGRRVTSETGATVVEVTEQHDERCTRQPATLRRHCVTSPPWRPLCTPASPRRCTTCTGTPRGYPTRAGRVPCAPPSRLPGRLASMSRSPGLWPSSRRTRRSAPGSTSCAERSTPIWTRSSTWCARTGVTRRRRLPRSQ